MPANNYITAYKDAGRQVGKQADRQTGGQAGRKPVKTDHTKTH